MGKRALGRVSENFPGRGKPRLHLAFGIVVWPCRLSLPLPLPFVLGLAVWPWPCRLSLPLALPFAIALAVCHCPWPIRAIGPTYFKKMQTKDENLQKEYLSYIKTAQDQFDEFSGAKICRVVKKEKEQPASTISGRDKKPGLPPHALAKGRLDNKSTRTIQNSENV